MVFQKYRQLKGGSVVFKTMIFCLMSHLALV